jgi:hypothetical protein
LTALEPFDRDKSVHTFEFAPEPSGVFKIIAFAAVGREHRINCTGAVKLR